MTQGKVYLVGAGPGDPGLVTCRAKELIASADVIVYDYLVHPELLTWCRADCEKIYVGKRPQHHARPQEEIEALLVARAETGQRVVRLKGGDPFVFGRGGEEARRLAADGIPFEIVPGVTAALAAAACTGIPLTQRNTSSALVFLTGHEDPQTHALATEWRRYGALPDATLAIYMGMGHLRLILSELVAGGLPPATPAAVVQWASLGRQRSVTGTAATLADLAESRRLDAPAIVLVGQVVRGHEKVNWFERLPLFGRRIVVTRAREQAGDLRRKLELLGADVLELPLVEIRPAADRETMLEIFAEVGQYDWLVFTSANGVRNFFDLFLEGFRDLRALGVMRIACVGEATARLVRALHLEVEICPGGGTSEELAEALIATGSLDSAKVLVITGNLNRDTLVKKLEAARAIVDTFQVYENVRGNLAGNAAAEDFRQSGADAVLFASSSAVRAFAAQAGLLQPVAGGKHPLAGSIGQRTSEAMRKAGIPVDFEAKESTLESLVAALVEKLGSVD
jgi:uroporphyrinogen III methyltransferase / synthase